MAFTTTSARLAVWALLVTAAASHEGHEEVEICACAAEEEVHPFTLSTTSCADATTLTAAQTTLETTTGANCQAVIVGTCATSATDATLVSGATHAEDCTGTGVFTLTTPDACDAKTGEVMECHKAFFILQAHHNYCDHDTLSEAQEHLVHDFEGACTACEVSRPKEDNLAACEVPADCEDPAPATAALKVLEDATCSGTAVTAATCTETAGTTVTIDATACAGVTGAALDTATACEALLTFASDDAQDDSGSAVTDVAACTYAPASGVQGCCRDAAEIAAYKTMVGYHANCHDEDTPADVETAIHTYEEPCEAVAECNSQASLVAGYDPLVCPPPPAPVTAAGTSAASTTSAALAVTALSALLQIALI